MSTKRTHGGKRKGAGRPIIGEPIDQRVAVYYRRSELDAIDATRGDVPRAEAIRDASLRGLGIETVGKE